MMTAAGQFLFWEPLCSSLVLIMYALHTMHIRSIQAIHLMTSQILIRSTVVVSTGPKYCVPCHDTGIAWSFSMLCLSGKMQVSGPCRHYVQFLKLLNHEMRICVIRKKVTYHGFWHRKCW
uniref:Putative secreted protein n=1 Tax=Rhipicephalus microplus TaxID=6941 RepID=A0A6G5A3G8_RHIMP